MAHSLPIGTFLSLIEDVESKLTLGRRATANLRGKLLKSFHAVSNIHNRRNSTRVRTADALILDAATVIPHEAERMIELIRMARHAAVSQVDRRKGETLLH